MNLLHGLKLRRVHASIAKLTGGGNSERERARTGAIFLINCQGEERDCTST